jgi:hypothetical protein
MRRLVLTAIDLLKKQSVVLALPEEEAVSTGWDSLMIRRDTGIVESRS